MKTERAIGGFSLSEGEAVERQAYKRGDSIELFDSKRFYIVEEGLVGIERDQIDLHIGSDDPENKWITRVIKPGGFFGFENFDGESKFEAKALTDQVVVRPIDIDMSDSDQVLALSRLIARTANEMERRQQFARSGYARQRISQALLDAEIGGNIQLTEKTIARMVGVSREKVSIEYGNLQDRRVITVLGPRSVRIQDAPRLRAFANKL